ncbi:MAG TPA: DUF4998 domain-containing protein [Pseudobacter sp.]|nr:DUF4998 domain-containing protein [Pseudobacter sp.]
MPRKYSYLLWISGLVCLLACTQKIDDFKDFLNNEEIKYPGVITKSFTRSGNSRLGVGWSPSPDPSITTYKVYWNNYRDSAIVPATTHSPGDTIYTILNNMQEYTYSLFVYSLDAKGNRSIPTEITNARVYGTNYSQTLMNRPFNIVEPYKLLNDEGNQIKLNFLNADPTNTITYIRYTSTADVLKEVTLAPDQSSITLNDYKYGTKVAFQSKYTPDAAALDSFLTTIVDTFPKIEFGIVKADKSLFQVVSMPNDVGPWESATSVARLWDGTTTPQGWNNIWHSNGDKQLPHHFTFDMGKAYDSLRTIEVTGRDCCHNPVDYEIWGIEDITNAATTLPGNDPGWKAEAISKGWTLLKEVVRTDGGVGPYTLTVSDQTPKMRYIRFRIKRVASNESAYSNLSEVTIGYKK